MKEHRKNLIRKASSYALKQKSEMDSFYKSHCLKNSDTLSIILKSHLYIENCLDEILRMNIPNPESILKKRFSDKLDIFIALNLGWPPGNGFIEEKLRLINKIRNSFAHNLNKKLTIEELQQLASGLTEVKSLDVHKLKNVLMGIIANLNALVAINEFYPILNFKYRNKEMLKRDLFWSETFLASYPYNEAKESMDFLKI